LKAEVDMYKRVPVVAAMSAELTQPGSYKATSIVDVPIIMTRAADGQIRASA